MNREDFMRMAIEAGWDAHHAEFDTRIQALALIVTSAAREACAKDLDDASEAAKDVDPQGFVWRAVKECAEAIRARGRV